MFIWPLKVLFEIWQLFEWKEDRLEHKKCSCSRLTCGSQGQWVLFCVDILQRNTTRVRHNIYIICNLKFAPILRLSKIYEGKSTHLLSPEIWSKSEKIYTKPLLVAKRLFNIAHFEYELEHNGPATKLRRFTFWSQ